MINDILNYHVTNNFTVDMLLHAPGAIIEKSQGTLITLSAITAAYIIYDFAIPKTWQENGLWYDKFAKTSNANPVNLISGYKWASTDALKQFVKEGGRTDCHLGNFRVDENFAKKVKMPKWWKNNLEKTEIWCNNQDLVESLLIIGKMKSGKSELYNYLISQKFYNRAIIHSIKISFEKYFYDRNSIILNPYLEKSHIWDVMSESEGTIKTFFLNYIKGTIGDKVDFFSASAERRFTEMMTSIKTHYKDATAAQKWILFIKTYKDFYKEVEGEEKNSKQDVVQTMESMIEPLEMIAWQLENNPRKKTFTIKDFFKMNNQARLFLSNQTTYQDKLTPLFAAFTAAVAKYHTSLAETKTDITFYVLDEYLSFVDIIDKAARKILHTLIRGHGGILAPGLQYLPSDKELLLDLTSSAFAWIFFSTIENETKEILISKTKYESWYQENSEKKGFLKKRSDDISKKQKNSTALTADILDGLGKKFEHIVYIPTQNILYRGYTPQFELIQKHDTLQNTNFDDFYKIKYKDTIDMSAEELETLSFADLYKDNSKLSKNERYKLWDQYEKLKTTEAKNKFKKKHNLHESEMKLLFEDFTQNKDVVANKMNIYNLEERLEIYSKFMNIDPNDSSAKFDFIEKHELWGALPAFFEFETGELW